MRLPGVDAGDMVEMERADDPEPIPTDATEVTAEQRELQYELDHQDDDPNAPASSQDHTKISDET